MEEVLRRFPHLSKQTFNLLSNKSLVKCLIVSKTWYHFITHENFYKLRAHYENYQKKVNWLRETPLHIAARNGQFLECKLIIDNVEDKNPTDNTKSTPFHFAVGGGHLNICKLMIEKIMNKNPANNWGFTPLSMTLLIKASSIYANS